MPSTIVNSARVSKTVCEIRDYLDRRSVDMLREELEHEGVAGLGQALVPGAERNVAVSGGLLGGWDFVDPLN